ncbi:hypothetical protein E3P91_01728 [Wallemia ichthyophaga]|nr:hypothetical protein E3P91_01728 [Wallemia ichthyophaga]TIB63631.1 hypothetical protein E3P78_01655 [Wallemia ichthyophaga]
MTLRAAINTSVRVGLRVRTSVRLYTTQQPRKVYSDASAAIADLRSRTRLYSGGFGLCGIPSTLIDAIQRRTDLHSLTAISNNPGVGEKGLARLLSTPGKVTRLICSYLGNNRTLEEGYRRGQITVELTPQGSIAERVSAAARGVPAFYTPTGAGTAVEVGGLVSAYDDAGNALAHQPPRETRSFGGRNYLLEHALHADVAIVRARIADHAGNLVFNSSANNFNSVMAKAAPLTIVEAEEIVDVGAIHPNHVHVPGVYVDRVCPATTSAEIEVLRVSEAGKSEDGDASETAATKVPTLTLKDRIARRAAREVGSGEVVNLGVGIPGRVPEYIPSHSGVTVQAENGLLNIGGYPHADAVDPDTINASKETVTLRKGAAAFGSDESFGMIRSGRIDVSMLGAFQVDCAGNLANYMIPDKLMKGMGGAMDLVSNPKHTRIMVLMEHNDKYGRSKVLNQCSLPLTGSRCIWKIITELAVFAVDYERGTLVLTDVAEDSTLDDVRRNTEADFIVSEELGTF